MPDSIEDKLPIINNKESNIVNGSKLKKKILVVGDWIVDDYWVIGDHRSPKSVRTGQMHHRALHTKHASIRAFCGAGRTASLLSQAIGDDGQPLFEIIGLGIWAKNDTDSLISMFVPENTIDVNPYHLNKEKRTPPNNVHLINLGMFLEKKGEKIDYATTRVIRSYHRSGQNVRQLQRLDWELPAKYKNDKDKLPEWVQDVKVLNKKLTQYLKDIVPDFNDIDAVVIKDLGKGVISRAIIKWLLINFKNKYWFISTKSWKPNWLISLKNFPLRLLVIPPVAANTARINNELNVWITKNGKPSKYALEISRKFYEDFKFKQEFTTIILPGGLKTLAIQWGDEKSKENGEIIVKHDILTENPIETSMASVFFAASVACLLARKPNLKELIEYSLNFTNRWQQHEIKRFTDPNRWDPQKTPFIVFGKDTTDTNEIQIKKGPLSFDNELNLWKRSLDPAKRGILKDEAYPKERIFELWRAMLEVDGYICCVESKQKSILKLVQAVNNFVELHSIQADRLKQSSCMLYAPPGSGKTSLVKKLAENNKLRFIPFNITQLINRRDILECFDTIVTYYLQNFKEPLLIFVDEINSKIDGEEAYSAFLTPLEDSVYIRGSKTFKLPPCFWIFASTQGEQEIKGETKGSDFCSRLTHGIISLGSMGKENEKRYLENVYVGVAMILASFPDVMSVSDGVLEVFYQFEERTKLREIRHFVEAFENVQYGKVNLSNMPHEWLENKSYARINEIIKTWREKYDVRILV